MQEAAAKFVVPSQILEDDVVTPEALDKAASALDRIGDKEKAAAMREQLKTKFPKYKAGA